MMDTKLIGKALKAIRNSKGYSLETASNGAKIRRETLRRYETDSEKMKFDIFRNLLVFYGIDVLSFFANIYDNSLVKEE